MNNELIPTSKVEIAPNYLKIAPDASEQDLQQIFEGITKVSSGSLWWIGDFLAQVTERKGEAYAKALEVTGYAHGTLENARRTCKHLTPEMRVQELSYKHHVEALSEAKSNVDLALKYLAVAKEENLSVSKMRKQIRLSLGENLPKISDKSIKDDYNAVELITFMDACKTIKRFLKAGKVKGIHADYFRGELEIFNELAEKLKNAA